MGETVGWRGVVYSAEFESASHQAHIRYCRPSSLQYAILCRLSGLAGKGQTAYLKCSRPNYNAAGQIVMCMGA